MNIQNDGHPKELHFHYIYYRRCHLKTCQCLLTKSVLSNISYRSFKTYNLLHMQNSYCLIMITDWTLIVLIITRSSVVGLHGDKTYNILFVETPRKFNTSAELSIRIISISWLALSTDEDPGLRIESFAVINLFPQTKFCLWKRNKNVSTNKILIIGFNQA